VYSGTYDNVIGFVHVRDLFGPGMTEGSGPVSGISRPVKFLPISKTVLSSLSEMRRERAHLAIVVDDYGGTAGIVTLEDLVEELIGDIRDEYDLEQDQATTLRGGEVEVDGLLNLDEFAEQTGLELPEGPYETAAGYVLAAFGDLPSVGDRVQVADRTITVTELDGRRIARLRVTPNPPPANPPPAGAAPPEAAPEAAPEAPSVPAAANPSVTAGHPVSAYELRSKVRLDSDTPRDGGPEVNGGPR
jgi:putative hemolysin